MTDKKLYSGFSLFGVPYNHIDIRYAAEQLYDTYTRDGIGPKDAMPLILNQNERVVSRCGMLIGFSGTLIALSLFIANKPYVLPTLWQQLVFYSVMLIWVVATMRLLWSLKHTFPPVWEFHEKYDFILTAELFLRRMGNYNIALIATIASFVTILVVLAPISATISDKLFPPLNAKSSVPIASASADTDNSMSTSK